MAVSIERDSRLLRELVDLEKPGTRKILAENGIRMFPGEIDITRWIVEIQGPPETPYEGARFYLSFEAGPNYPFDPPRIRFITDIYHMNISCGFVCISILEKVPEDRPEGEWMASLTFEKIALSIVSMLGDPNPEEPLVESIASQYMIDPTVHFDIACDRAQQNATVVIDEGFLNSEDSVHYIKGIYRSKGLRLSNEYFS